MNPEKVGDGVSMGQMFLINALTAREELTLQVSVSFFFALSHCSKSSVDHGEEAGGALHGPEVKVETLCVYGFDCVRS